MKPRALHSHRVSAAVVFTAIVTCGGLARAQSASQCDAIFHEANELRDQCFSRTTEPNALVDATEHANWNCVAAALEERRRHWDSPVFRYLRGYSAVHLQQWALAWNLLQGALASGDPCVNDPSEAARELAASRAHVVLLAPVSNVPGTHLEVNGVDVGPLPLNWPYAVEPGTVRVRMSRVGFLPWERSITPPQAEVWNEHVVLQPVPPPPPPPRPPTPPLRTAGWATLATGAALGVAGVVFWALSYDTAARFDTYCVRPAGAAEAQCRDAVPPQDRMRGTVPTQLDADALCRNPGAGTALAEMCARREAFPLAAVALGVGSGVAIAAGVTVLLAAPSRARPTMSMAGWVQQDGGGVSLRGVF